MFANPKIFNSVGLKWGPETCYFIKLHGDSETPSQLKISNLDQTHIVQMRKLRSREQKMISLESESQNWGKFDDDDHFNLI